MSTSKSEYLTEILDATELAGYRAALSRAGDLLRTGELVVIPTETVYGLAASAIDSAAVRRIFAVKDRPQDNPLIVHLESVEAALDLCPRDLPKARELLERFAPGPITVVVPSDGRFAPEINHGLDTVALRVPALPVARDVIAATGVPLAAPSANRSGRPSPTSAAMARAEMDGRVAAILDGGPCPVGIESTVVDATDPERLRILRPGHITAEEISRAVGLPVADGTDATGATGATGADAADEAARRSPGTRYRHYTPGIPVVLVAGELIDQALEDPRITGDRASAWMLRLGGAGGERHRGSGSSSVRIVEIADAGEYARRLFNLFWSAEQAGASMILAQEPDRSVSPGLADRLERAASLRYPELPRG